MVLCVGTQASPGHAQWSVFFFRQKGLDMKVFEKRIEAHPFVASSERQTEKPLGGHLSPWNLSSRTNRSSASSAATRSTGMDNRDHQGKLRISG